MAVIPYTFVSLIPQFWGNNAVVYTWANMNSGDTGQPVQGPGFTDRSFQVEGGVTTVLIEGSNDSVNFRTLNDAFGNPLTYNGVAIRQVTEIALLIRPNCQSGGSVTVTAVFCNHQYN